MSWTDNIILILQSSKRGDGHLIRIDKVIKKKIVSGQPEI